MRFQISRLEGEIRIRDAMAAIESVIGELGHQREDLRRLLLLDAPLDRALDEPLFMNGHLLALLLAHRATHEVGFAKCIAGKLLRELHYLLLVDDDAVSVVQDLLHLRHEVTNGFLPMVTLDKFIDHAAIERPRTIKSIKRGEIFEALRLQLPANLLH